MRVSDPVRTTKSVCASILSILIAGAAPIGPAVADTRTRVVVDRLPVPQPRPGASRDEPARPPLALPVPRPKPLSAPAAPVADGEPATAGPPAGPVMLPRRETPARSPAEEAACRTRLAGLGVVYADIPDIAEPGGCHAEGVVAVTALGSKLALSGSARMVCPLAEALARWGEEVVRPAAERQGRKAVTLSIGSGYACRPRNRRAGSKLSEHGAANAIDVVGVRFADGTEMSVIKAGARAAPRPIDAAAGPEPAAGPDAAGDRDARFLAEIRAGACKHFTTVLGPGQAWHADHLHLDLGMHGRSGTYRICQ